LPEPRFEYAIIERLDPFNRLVFMTSVDRRVESPGTPGAPLSLIASRRDAFERLTQGRLDRAYRLAATILGGDIEAEDAVHDAAVQAWISWASLRDQSRFDAWFDRIVVNVCRDRLRRSATSSRKVPELMTNASEADLADQAGHEDALRRAVGALTVEHKIVVVLRFLDDLSIEEIGIRTGLRTGTVRSRLHYALRELRAAYDAAQRKGGTDR
jgi:RNA polymerase sigma-70 factor (ECF subfamily)